jgi:peptide deformylase
VPDEEISGDAIQGLLKALSEELEAQRGVGLAAPQIGVSLAVAIARDPAVPGGKTLYGPANFARLERVSLTETVLINPRIVERSEEQVPGFETCLSVAGLVGVVPLRGGCGSNTATSTDSATQPSSMGFRPESSSTRSTTCTGYCASIACCCGRR